MKAFAVRRGEKSRDLTGAILCQDVRPAFRKGHLLRAEDIPNLIAASWSELHLIEPGPDDIPQREAGERLAQILWSEGMQIAPAGHRHVLKAQHNGLLNVEASALQRLNRIDGIAVFTLMNDSVVSAGQVVVEAQITPLAIERVAIDEAARESNIVRLLPFVPRDVVILTRGDGVAAALTGKLRWFGCAVREIAALPGDAPSIREVIERAAGTLVMVSGSNALDPLDPVFVALGEMGAKMQRIGMPVHPGTLLWMASWKSTVIIGLPSCGLGPRVTAFDLVLPKVLAEGAIRDEELAALGHGGILTFTRSRALAQETVDEPVR